MSEIRKPDYLHYSRLKILRANEAQLILTDIELGRKGITESDEYNKRYEEETLKASRALATAFDTDDQNDRLTYGASDDPYVSISGQKNYFFNNITIKVAEFCTWAAKKGYKLPKELAALSATPIVAEADQGKVVDNKVDITDSDNTKVVEGLLKMVIAMAIKGYSYKPGERSETVREIMTDIEQVGLSLSENTIRQRLKDASELLSRNEIKTQ